MNKILRRFAAFILIIACLLTLSATALADSTQPKLIAFTFDDGPGAYTETLLAGLAERNAKATFFISGYRVDSYPGVLEQIVEGGHQLANHTYNHYDLNGLSAEAITREIDNTRDLLVQAGGEQTYYIRAPYGNANQTVRSLAGAPMVYWSIDTLDWQTLNTQSVKNVILNNAYDGAIVLMHDIHRTSVPAALEAMDVLAERGYEFVTVEQLLLRRGITPENGVVYYDAKNMGITLPADAVGPGAYDESKLEEHWGYEALRFCLDWGYLQTDSQGRVLPNQPITRGDFVAALGRFCGTSDAYRMQSDYDFTDVANSDPRRAYIDWAYDVGLMAGYNNLFRPDDKLTREEIATVLTRYLVMRGKDKPGGSISMYKDADRIADWAVDGVRLCTKLGILQGSNYYFLPKLSLTRAEAATILQRLTKY